MSVQAHLELLHPGMQGLPVLNSCIALAQLTAQQSEHASSPRAVLCSIRQLLDVLL